MGSKLQATARTPQVYFTRDVQKLFEILSVIYGIRKRRKLLETMVMNQILVVAQMDRKQMKGEQKVALDFCKKFAAEYEKRQEVINAYDRCPVSSIVDG